MTSVNIGHGHFDATGKGHHNKGDADQHLPGMGGIPGQAFEPFGHFSPMIHNAPIHAMTTRHGVVTHAACGSRIHHDGHSLNFECGGCGSVITDVSELTS